MYKPGIPVASLVKVTKTLSRSATLPKSINRDQLKSLTSLDQSLMPNGLEAGLTHQNIADLLEFLKTTN